LEKARLERDIAVAREATLRTSISRDEAPAASSAQMEQRRLHKASSADYGKNPRPRRGYSLQIPKSGAAPSGGNSRLTNRSSSMWREGSTPSGSTQNIELYSRPSFSRRFPSRISTVVPNAHESDIFSIASSFDGSMIATGGDDRRIRIATLHSNAPVEIIDDPIKSIKALEFMHTDSVYGGDNSKTPLLCAGLSDGNIQLYSRNTKKQGRWDCKRVEPVHSSAVRSIQYRQDSGDSRILSASTDRTVCLTDMSTGQNLFTGKAPSACLDATLLTIGGSGEILSAHRDGEIRLWCPRQRENDGEGIVIDGVRVHSKAAIAIAALDDGVSVVSLGRDDKIKLSDVRMSLKVVREFETAEMETFSDWQKLCVDGRVVYCGMGHSQGLGVWDSSTGKFETTLDCKYNPARTSTDDLISRKSNAELPEVLIPFWTEAGEFVCAHQNKKISFWSS